MSEIKVCDRCGRVLVMIPKTEKEQSRWLIHRNAVRCPQHITRTSLSRTKGKTERNIEWAKQAKEADARESGPIPSNPLVYPYEAQAQEGD